MLLKHQAKILSGNRSLPDHQNHKTGCLRNILPDSPVFHAVPPMFQSVSRLRT